MTRKDAKDLLDWQDKMATISSQMDITERQRRVEVALDGMATTEALTLLLWLCHCMTQDIEEATFIAIVNDDSADAAVNASA